MKQVASPVRRLRKISLRRKDRQREGAEIVNNAETYHDAREGRNGHLPMWKEGDHSLGSSSSEKPLPNGPSESTPPAITVDNSPDLRQLRLESPSMSQLRSQASASSMNRTSNVSSNTSENWTGPEDAEGAYIRRTYAYFDTSGVKGDGLLDGKEWTREKSNKAAWDPSQTSLRIRGSPDNDSASIPYLSPQPSIQEDIYSPPTPAFTAHESLAASSSSLGFQSESSVLEAAMEGRSGKDGTYDGLEAERKEAIKHIDRYGFFNREPLNECKSRITIVPANPLQSIPKRRITPMGLKAARPLRSARSSEGGGSQDNSIDAIHRSSSDKSTSRQASLQSVMMMREEREVALREREALRVAKWERMLEARKPDNEPSCYYLASGVFHNKKFRRRVYKGIPDRWRSAAWWAIMLEQSGGSHPLAETESRYKALLDVPSPHDVQIDLDVPRTISGHVLFHTRYGQGQRSLFHVLHAFSLLCSDCAYCQGMGPIVATLLVYFTPDKAYSLMVHLHNQPHYGLHTTFSPGFPGLVENFHVQKKLCEKLCPEIHQSLEVEGIDTSSYATKWYITLFTNVLPFSTQLRIWDCYLLQGQDLLVIVSIAILWSLGDHIIGGGFESVMNLLTREFLPVDDDVLLNWVFVVMEREDTRKRIKAARAEYRELKSQGKEPLL